MSEQLGDRRKSQGTTSLSLSILLTLLTAVLSLGISWGTARSALEGKVDRVTYTEDKAAAAQVDSAILNELRGLRSDVRQVKSYLCRGRANEMGCQP